MSVLDEFCKIFFICFVHSSAFVLLPVYSWTDFMRFYVIMRSGDRVPPQTICHCFVLSNKFKAYV